MPSAGHVSVDGIDAVDAPEPLRRRCGFMPETPPLYDEMRVADFLVWCGQIKGGDRATIEERLPEVADICDIDDKLGDLISTLSHGYRKRVGIAQAIIHDPALVILDEPISGLDPAQIVEMRDVLDRLRERCTVLVSSHILSEISETCDRVLVLHDGRLVADGTESDLVERLGAGARLEMHLRGDRETIEEVLEDFHGARAASPPDDGARAASPPWSIAQATEDVYHIDITLAEDRREQLVAALVEAGVGIRRVEESESELERAFLGVTGESEEAA
jgi:ABC-2 type transport system ATP-binding protein